MKDTEDRKLSGYFDQLRHAEQSQAPAFSSLLEDAGNKRSAPLGPIPAVGLAVAILTLSIVILVAVHPGIGSDSPDPLANRPLETDQQLLDMFEELPTDFLLETPWSQMASLDAPEQLLEQHYEILEELTDES